MALQITCNWGGITHRGALDKQIDFSYPQYHVEFHRSIPFNQWEIQDLKWRYRTILETIEIGCISSYIDLKTRP